MIKVPPLKSVPLYVKSAPFLISQFKIKWTSSCGGSFYPSDTIKNPRFVAPTNTSINDCVLSATVTDACNRENFGSKFVFIFAKVLGGVLKPLTAKPVQQGVLLNWVAENIQTGDRFFIEKSSDGIIFNAAGELLAAQNVNDYSFVDRNPYARKSWYRVKLVTNAGVVSYTNILLTENNSIESLSLSIVPNPLNASSLVTVYADIFSTAELLITDPLGRIMVKKSIQLSQGKNQIPVVNLMKSVKGCYFIQIRHGSLIAANKFCIN